MFNRTIISARPRARTLQHLRSTDSDILYVHGACYLFAMHATRSVPDDVDNRCTIASGKQCWTILMPIMARPHAQIARDHRWNDPYPGIRSEMHVKAAASNSPATEIFLNLTVAYARIKCSPYLSVIGSSSDVQLRGNYFILQLSTEL